MVSSLYFTLSTATETYNMEIGKKIKNTQWRKIYIFTIYFSKLLISYYKTDFPQNVAFREKSRSPTFKNFNHKKQRRPFLYSS
jgi:hypothetical protein